MLSRTADHLYWMARYIERAENMARVLDVTYRMSLVPHAAHSEEDLWMLPVRIVDDVEGFERDYGAYNATNVMRYMALDERNASSIFESLASARENARSVRVAMSSEMWESVNSLWLELQQRVRNGLNEGDYSEFCEWVKSRSHLFRGVTVGTMLRDDGYMFVRLGTFIERADNTARLLDAKYQQLYGPKSGGDEESDSSGDYYEWSSLLRSVSAMEAYQKVFRDTIDAGKVAELLILRDDMPRSLHTCLDEITPILEKICADRGMECMRQAGELHAKLHFGRMNVIADTGLHEFLQDFILLNNNLGVEIQKTFLNAPIR
ncbi:MAG TPA: alpha-E domain-containing protein [Methylophilaceae bacterium]|jgi:uncharacterized alpha-E superfamily protein